MNALHDLAGPYVLDALDDPERRAFEDHLEGCVACQSEVAELSLGIEAMFDELTAEAPASLRTEVLDEIDGPVVTSLRRAPSRKWITATAIAAAAAVVVGGYALFLRSEVSEARRLSAILTSPEAATVDLEGVTGRVVYSQRRAVFISGDLPEPAADRTYQLWLIGPDGPSSAGMFRPRPDGVSVVLLEGEATPGLVVGVTEEPAGGSDQPTGDILATAEL